MVAGSLEGHAPNDVEVLALEWTAITVGRFLAARHEGSPGRARVEIGIALSAVHEWFPVRTLVAETLERAGLDGVNALDSWSAVLLAEQLDLPLFTASDEVTSIRIEILRPGERPNITHVVSARALRSSSDALMRRSTDGNESRSLSSGLSAIPRTGRSWCAPWASNPEHADEESASDPLAVVDQVVGGSMRSTVPTRSMDRSNDAMRLTPVLSAQATR